MLTETSTSTGAPAINHWIYAAGLPPSAFTYASDLSSARVVGRGSFFRGGLDFTGTAVVSPTLVNGSITGNFKAHFDGIGTIEPHLSTPESTLSK